MGQELASGGTPVLGRRLERGNLSAYTPIISVQGRLVHWTHCFYPRGKTAPLSPAISERLLNFQNCSDLPRLWSLVSQKQKLHGIPYLYLAINHLVPSAEAVVWAPHVTPLPVVRSDCRTKGLWDSTPTFPDQGPGAPRSCTFGMVACTSGEDPQPALHFAELHAAPWETPGGPAPPFPRH